MTWKRDLNTAPKGPELLVRIDGWDCPIVVRWTVWETTPTRDIEGWAFCDGLIAEACDPLEGDELKNAEWMEIPK